MPRNQPGDTERRRHRTLPAVGLRRGGEQTGVAKALSEGCGRFGWVLHAYCIMDNHFHLAVETPQGNLSVGMRWLQAAFANRFNRFR